jgi:hypothetical protein
MADSNDRTVRAKKGRFFPMTLKEVVTVVSALEWSDKRGERLRVRFENPRTDQEDRHILWIVEPQREVRVLSVPLGLDVGAIKNAIQKGCERLGSLRHVKHASTRVVTFEIYLRDDERGWGVRRREKYFKQQKYRSAQKFSSAFKPKLAREVVVEV